MATKVTFTLSAEIISGATGGVVLGEFNDWDDSKGIILKKQKDGSFKATALLAPGKMYQYRYLLNDGRWVNDERAEQYVHADGYHVENCVVIVPAAVEKLPKATKVVKEPKQPKEKKAVVKPVTATETVAADDLTKIEGIGKKINELLAAAQIVSFKDLSKASAKKLKGILEAAGNKFKMHDPATWPKQAKLAAAGKWEELEVLQKELTGGKE